MLGVENTRFPYVLGKASSIAASFWLIENIRGLLFFLDVILTVLVVVVRVAAELWTTTSGWGK